MLAAYAGRFRTVWGEHGGLSVARNVCLTHARGEWIAFHDADDVALPDRLAFQTQFLRDHPEYDALFCNGERLSHSGGQAPRLVPPELARHCHERVLTVRDVFAGFPIYFQGALIPRRVFEAVGLFDPTLRVQPDIEYGYRLVAACRALFLDRVTFRYRWHTTNNSGDRLGGREDIARILENLCRNAPNTVKMIGARRLRARLARHYFRIARHRLSQGKPDLAEGAVRRALELSPLHPRYQLFRLWHLRRPPSTS